MDGEILLLFCQKVDGRVLTAPNLNKELRIEDSKFWKHYLKHRGGWKHEFLGLCIRDLKLFFIQKKCSCVPQESQKTQKLENFLDEGRDFQDSLNWTIGSSRKAPNFCTFTWIRGEGCDLDRERSVLGCILKSASLIFINDVCSCTALLTYFILGYLNKNSSSYKVPSFAALTVAREMNLFVQLCEGISERKLQRRRCRCHFGHRAKWQREKAAASPLAPCNGATSCCLLLGKMYIPLGVWKSNILNFYIKIVIFF